MASNGDSSAWATRMNIYDWEKHWLVVEIRGCGPDNECECSTVNIMLRSPNHVSKFKSVVWSRVEDPVTISHPDQEEYREFVAHYESAKSRYGVDENGYREATPDEVATHLVGVSRERFEGRVEKKESSNGK